MRPLETYHWAWLTAHPERSQEWLRAKLLDGFDIHHIDGNHENDDPANLCLLEHVDHMRLHGTPMRRGRGTKCANIVSHPLDEDSYNLRLLGKCWYDIGQDLGISEGMAAQYAKRWCLNHNISWPMMPLQILPRVKRLRAGQTA